MVGLSFRCGRVWRPHDLTVLTPTKVMVMRPPSDAAGYGTGTLVNEFNWGGGQRS